MKYVLLLTFLGIFFAGYSFAATYYVIQDCNIIEPGVELPVTGDQEYGDCTGTNDTCFVYCRWKEVVDDGFTLVQSDVHSVYFPARQRGLMNVEMGPKSPINGGYRTIFFRNQFTFGVSANSIQQFVQIISSMP